MALVAFAVVALAAGFLRSRGAGAGLRGPGERVAVRMDIPQAAGPQFARCSRRSRRLSEVEGWHPDDRGRARRQRPRGADPQGRRDPGAGGAAPGDRRHAADRGGAYALFNMGLARLDQPAAQVIRALAERLLPTAARRCRRASAFRPNAGAEGGARRRPTGDPSARHPSRFCVSSRRATTGRLARATRGCRGCGRREGRVGVAAAHRSFAGRAAGRRAFRATRNVFDAAERRRWWRWRWGIATATGCSTRSRSGRAGFALYRRRRGGFARTDAGLPRGRTLQRVRGRRRRRARGRRDGGADGHGVSPTRAVPLRRAAGSGAAADGSRGSSW